MRQTSSPSELHYMHIRLVNGHSVRVRVRIIVKVRVKVNVRFRVGAKGYG